MLVAVLCTTGCGVIPLEPRWLKASLHVHTTHSDGENTPSEVLRWYADHGYDVVAITDHNRGTTFGEIWAAPPGLLVIPGVEFTSEGDHKPVHVNGLFVIATPKRLEERTAVGALTRMLAFFAQAGGLAVVNHPNYGHAVNLDDLLQTNTQFLEVFNASSGSENDGGYAPGGSSEELWDGLLARGRRVYGLAVDDMHALPGGKNPNRPGGGFVMLYAHADWLSVHEALMAGRFYASSGPVLRSADLSPSRVHVVPQATTGCVWQMHGAREDVLPGGPLDLRQPAHGYVRAVYDCGEAGSVFLQPLFAQ